MKRIISLLLVLTLMLNCCLVLAEQAPAAETPEHHTLETRTYPVVLGDVPEPSYELPLVFVDGVNDMPYLNLPDYVTMVNSINSETGTRYDGVINEEMNYYSIINTETDTYTVFGFTEGVCYYSDFDAMEATANGQTMDILYSSGINAETGLPELFSRVTDPMMVRPGNVRIIELKEYGIPMIAQDGMYLVPLHTAFDLLFGIPNGYLIYFNGEKVYMGGPQMFAEWVVNEETGEETRQLTQTGQDFYSVQPTMRSKELAEYGVAELAMEMDHFYGLKAAHNVDSFALLLSESRYDDRLTSEDPAEADAALADFIHYYLDDLHSGFNLNSWMTGYETELDTHGTGYSTILSRRTMRRFAKARDFFYPEGVPPYQEVGNTAYITFDEFNLNLPRSDYYTLDLDDPACIRDTISLVLYANHQIRREGSPIQNVVLDLSNNGGGDVDAAIFILGWYLGVTPITFVNTFSSGQSTCLYSVDTDLDHQFTDDDYLAYEYHLYCLTSGNSFSCGNLVPWIFKTSGLVTLIGDTTGGGSCVVQNMTTAWGSTFQTSGYSRLAFLKNGSYYDVDQGIEPDVVLTRLESYYDRERLTSIINALD